MGNSTTSSYVIAVLPLHRLIQSSLENDLYVSSISQTKKVDVPIAPSDRRKY